MKNKIFILTVFFMTFFLNLFIPFSENMAASNSIAEGFNLKDENIKKANSIEKEHLSFAVFADTHIGARYQFPFLLYGTRSADFLDKIGNDLVDSTNLLDFAIHVGDIVNHNTGHVNGIGLPWFVNKYKNNLKRFLISNVNIPFHFVLGNHDLDDYELNPNNPHKLVESIIDETSLNNPVYAMMRDNILFLIVPELGHVQWTHPILYQWIEFMTQSNKNTTTIILCHQAIEDTTEDYYHVPYRGKQDLDWWTNLFKNNNQIKMWIHGHNHYVDWYVGNRSSGLSYPIQYFDHEMAFSAPYPQLDLYGLFEEDRVIIYNISNSKITTSAWENNGLRGRWVPDYDYTWDISTTYDPSSEDWYAFPMFLQDNETQLTDMKVLSPNIKLQLVGTKPMELFYDPKMECPTNLEGVSILGFGNDRTDNIVWTDPGMKIIGPASINFPEKYPLEGKNHEDGRSGPSYHSFPMGTICSAVPGMTYNFTIIGRSKSGEGRFVMNISCSDWDKKTQYSVLPSSEKNVISHEFSSDYEKITCKYTVPNDNMAWFLQGTLNFLDTTEYEILLFSIMRDSDSYKTKDLHLHLGSCWYNQSGFLDVYDTVDFSVDPITLSDINGVMNFSAQINGNKFGIINLIYQEPIILSRNARFSLNSIKENRFNLSIKKTISKSSKTFELYPFSNSPIYEFVNILSSDGSNIRHESANGNIWFTCNCPENKKSYLEISFNNGIIKKPRQNCIYLFNNKIAFPKLSQTIVFGKINIEIDTFDIENVSKVEFFVDNFKEFEDFSPPFQWLWNDFSFNQHKLIVKTHYKNGNVSEDKINLWKFL